MVRVSPAFDGVSLHEGAMTPCIGFTVTFLMNFPLQDMVHIELSVRRLHMYSSVTAALCEAGQVQAVHAFSGVDHPEALLMSSMCCTTEDVLMWSAGWSHKSGGVMSRYSSVVDIFLVRGDTPLDAVQYGVNQCGSLGPG